LRIRRQQKAFIYKGVEGFKNYLRDILKVGGDVYTIGGRGALLDPRLNTFMASFWKEAQDIIFHALFDSTAKEHIKEFSKKDNLEYRIIPEQYSTQMTIDIYGDRVITLVEESLGELAERITIFMTISDQLAQSYRQIFQFMWDNCKKSGK
jgi:hypothetical protein